MCPTEKSKIIICYHKDSIVIKNDDVLIPLFVGREQGGPEVLEEIQGDNEGDNISYKNKLYCELTGLYWLWKNVDADNYGLFHYRRFLDISNKYSSSVDLQNINVSDWSEEAVAEAMKDCDIILPKPMNLGLSVYNHYNASHITGDLDLLLRIIKDNYPEYSKVAEEFMAGSEMSICNMFVMKKHILNEYCNWVFDVLQKTENEIDLTNRTSYQVRALAFMAERLLNIFIRRKIESNPDIKVKYVNLLSFSGL